MDEFSIIGISRGNEYSPNHVDNDAAIFNKVADELRLLGCKVELYAEKEFVACGAKADVIFDMARDRATIARLKSLRMKVRWLSIRLTELIIACADQ